jgi:hypothetical protein
MSTDVKRKQRREYMRRYRALNPDKTALWGATSNLRRVPTPEGRAKARARYKNNKLYRDRQRHRSRLGHVKTRYGITFAERDALLASQGGECAICSKRDARWHIDHNHQSSKVRGILCHQCNVMLGMAGDDPRRLRAAAKYLEIT